jgi:hypothetical protein
VLSFRLSLDLILNASPHLFSYRVVLNPQLRDSQETLRENRRRENLQRRTSQGRGQLPIIHNILSMKTLLCNCRGARNPNFRRNFAELMCYHQPSIVVLVETRISSQRAEIISMGLGFDSVIRYSLLYMLVLYMHLAFIFGTTLCLLPTYTPCLG